MPGSWKRAAARELGTMPASHTTGERGCGTKWAMRAATALQTASERPGGTRAFYTLLGVARGLEGERSGPREPCLMSQRGKVPACGPHTSFLVLQDTALGLSSNFLPGRFRKNTVCSGAAAHYTDSSRVCMTQYEKNSFQIFLLPLLVLPVDVGSLGIRLIDICGWSSEHNGCI